MIAYAFGYRKVGAFEKGERNPLLFTSQGRIYVVVTVRRCLGIPELVVRQWSPTACPLGVVILKLQSSCRLSLHALRKLTGIKSLRSIYLHLKAKKKNLLRLDWKNSSGTLQGLDGNIKLNRIIWVISGVFSVMGKDLTKSRNDFDWII